jgi:cytochrome P450
VTTVVQVLSPRYLADPYSYYDLLRSVDPVSWDHSGKLWLLTRYADVSAALRNPALSSRRKHLSATPVPEPTRQALQSVEQYLATWLIRMDPPAHSRLRSLAKRAFSLRLLERTRPLIRSARMSFLTRYRVCREMLILLRNYLHRLHLRRLPT